MANLDPSNSNDSKTKNEFESRVECAQTLFETNDLEYECFNCGESLHARATKAGTIDYCPVCKVQLIVPGQHVLEQLAPSSGATHSKLQKRYDQKAKSRIQTVKREKVIEVLEHKLENDVRLVASESQLETERIVKQSSLENFEISTESRLRRTASMEQAVIVFTQMTADAIEQVREKEWSPKLIAETIQRILNLKKRTCEKITENDSVEKP